MGSDKTQIGARVDDDVWERFKRYVEDKHGRKRGVLSHEVEKALENHISGEYPNDRLARIENDVATIKANLAETDGGEVAVPEPTPDPSTDRSHTHAPTESNISSNGTSVDVGGDDPTKPNRKAPKAEKAEYVFGDLNNDDAIVINPKALRKRIDKAWGFGERATNDLIDILYTRFNAKPVRKDASSVWSVALGRSEDDREDAIDEWAQGGEYEFVDPDTVDRKNWPL